MRGNVFVEEERINKPGKIIKINQKIQLRKVILIGFQGEEQNLMQQLENLK